MKAADRAVEVLARLKQEYPEAHCALDHENPYQLLVATILSAQCTDARVNLVTPALFRRYPEPADLAAAKPAQLEEMIRSTGFYRNKAKSLSGMAARVAERHGGRIPESMEELVELPGVARKTANVVLGTAFGRNEGVVVDTHVARLSRRMGLTRQTDPVRIERDLMRLFPREEWTDLSHRLIQHGRLVCDARRPRCAACVMGPDACASYEPDGEAWKKGKKAATTATAARKTAKKPTKKTKAAAGKAPARKKVEKAKPARKAPARKKVEKAKPARKAPARKKIPARGKKRVRRS